jgi:hypothetical protein
MNTVIAIDRILEMGRRQSTYKLAVLRAVVETVIERPGQEPRNGFHLLPVIEVARRFLSYYWKPALLGIAQGTQATVVANSLRQLAEDPHPGLGFDLGEASAGARLADWIEGATLIPDPVIGALLRIRQVILEQPLRHLPNIGSDRRLEVFNIVTIPRAGEESRIFTDGYEAHLMAAPGRNTFRGAVTWRDLLDRERTNLVLSARAWEEIAEFRFWLLDAILMRWIRECERFAGGDMAVPASSLSLDRPERDAWTTSAMRTLWADLGVRTCLYTGEELDPRAMVVDHMLPFSRFPVNLFWNLVPTSASLNGEKSDRLPRLTPGVTERYHDYLTHCVRSQASLVPSHLDWTWRKYYQQQGFGPLSEAEVVGSLEAVMERTWARLERAGVAVWEAA